MKAHKPEKVDVMFLYYVIYHIHILLLLLYIYKHISYIIYVMFLYYVIYHIRYIVQANNEFI